MPPVRYQLPPLADDADFDRLCRDLFRHHWPVEGDQLNGRSGQRQDGVDFYGRDPQGHWRGGQSKSRNSPTAPLGEAEVREEVRKALEFTPALHEYVIATSGPRDARLQQIAREITDAHRKRRPAASASRSTSGTICSNSSTSIQRSGRPTTISSAAPRFSG